MIGMLVLTFVDSGNVASGQPGGVLSHKSFPADRREGLTTTLPVGSGITPADRAAQLESVGVDTRPSLLVEPMTSVLLPSDPSQVQLRTMPDQPAPGLEKPKSLEDLRRRIAQETGMPTAGELDEAPPANSRQMDEVRKALGRAMAGGLDPSLAREARATGEARLRADIERLGGRDGLRSPSAARKVPANPPGLARKLDLLPLPTHLEAPAAMRSPQERGIERLTTELAEATSSGDRHRLMLSLAAGHVGQGQLDAARALYQDIAENSDEEDIRQTARRNLEALVGR